MMNIRVIFYGSIYDRNGAAKVVRSFAENGQSFFDYCGHNVAVFDKSCAAKFQAEKESKEKVCETKSSLSLLKLLKRRVKSFLDKAVMEKYAKSYKEKRDIEKYLWVDRGRGVVDNYYSSGLNDEAYIFHDIFACWAFVDHCKSNNLELKKFILVLHTSGVLFESMLTSTPNIKGTRYLKIMNRRAETCYSLAQRIVFVSERSAVTFQEHYPQYADKVKFVYNGIEDRVSNIGPVFDGKIRMVTVGTVTKRKNQIMLIDCLKQIRKQYDATLTVIGGGPALEESKHRAKDLNLEQMVNFLGSIDGVADELEKCNLFVMSSFNEGLPIAAIEALRAKLPVVMTDVGGCRELIEDNGYLVQPNIDEITDAVIDFGKDVEKQKKMSEASIRLFKQKFKVDAMIKSYSEIIKEVLP